jgi:hypothetical protein
MGFGFLVLISHRVRRSELARIFEGIVREDKRYGARVARQFAAQAFPGPDRTRQAKAGMTAPLGAC